MKSQNSGRMFVIIMTNICTAIIMTCPFISVIDVYVIAFYVKIMTFIIVNFLWNYDLTKYVFVVLL